MSDFDILQSLVLDEGYEDVHSMLEDAVIDSICPAICVECGYITEMEPDQDRGYCEDCGQNTVKSALILAGLI